MSELGSDLPRAEWLRAFEATHGRRLRVLHIGNIANNAYINAKIQRDAGIEADVACLEYYHVMGCPEWEDADFEGDLGDPFFPDWWAVDLRGFCRPRWFVQGLTKTCQRYLSALQQGERLKADLLWRRLTVERWLLCRGSQAPEELAPTADHRRSDGKTGEDPRGRVDEVAQATTRRAHAMRIRCARTIRRLTHTTRGGAVRGLVYARLLRQIPSRLRNGIRGVRAGRPPGALRRFMIGFGPRRFERLARSDAERTLASALMLQAEPSSEGLDQRMDALYREHFPTAQPLDPSDYIGYRSAVQRWSNLLPYYDIVQGYAIDPIVPVLAGFPRRTGYEHGTLRSIPFEDSSRGRLCALGFREACAVFVTNTDVLPSAARLGLAPERIVCLPHAVDSRRIVDFARDNAHRRPGETHEVTFFSPARQDWRDKDPSMCKGNDSLLHAIALLVREGRSDFSVLLARWGRDVEASEALIDELGIRSHIRWTHALKKRALWETYLSTHAIIDQFTAPAMGGVTFESLGLGCRVITALDLPVVGAFFGEPPPVLACVEPAEIASAMCAVLDDPRDTTGRGAAGQDWFLRFHSSERILELQLAQYQAIVAELGAATS